MGMPVLELKKLSKTFVDEVGYRISLFKDISLSAEKGKITVVLAPKGSGKTSLLKIAAGLDKEYEGEVISGGKIPFIPSAPSSFPWLNVKGNIKFVNEQMPDKDCIDIINLVGLEGYEDHHPQNDSIGFRLRVSLGRALAVKPELILLDEPFTGTDEITRNNLYQTILSINKNTGTSILIATTNITEALYLADKIYIMKKDPGEILAAKDISFPFERNLDSLAKDEFIRERTDIENLLKSSESYRLYDLSI